MEGFAKAPFWLDDYGDRVPSPVHGEWHVYDTVSVCKYGTLAFGSVTFIDSLFTVQYLAHATLWNTIVFCKISLHSTPLAVTM